MRHAKEFLIGGAWVSSLGDDLFEIIDPATEEPLAQIASATAADVDRAVAAARAAFPSFARTSAKERAELLAAVLEVLRRRNAEVGALISQEMGAPLAVAVNIHGKMAMDHFESMIGVLGRVRFASQEDDAEVIREPIGVCGIITPWNAPVSQIAGKVVPALAAGCTMVVKPSEFAPLSPLLFAEIMHEAGVPAGVFNLVNGNGQAGAALAAHPGVDMVSFTGSTRTGIAVAKAAAETIKRVHQELGGKGANIILPDADMEKSVRMGVMHCFANSGQVCSAPTRMLVPADRHDEVVRIARSVAEAVVVGAPEDQKTQLGPLVSHAQFSKVQDLIASGISEGAELVTGGKGRPDGLDRGYYARPTVFAGVTPEMTIAQTEIFGPVLSIMPYQDEADAIRIANGTPYGLSAYVCSSSNDAAKRFASQLQAGLVTVNYTPRNPAIPFGGYKQSGNGRQNGLHGLLEYTEVKAIVGLQ
jgi:aldehyde dehydrogenase (NAD+)